MQLFLSSKIFYIILHGFRQVNAHAGFFIHPVFFGRRVFFGQSVFFELFHFLSCFFESFFLFNAKMLSQRKKLSDNCDKLSDRCMSHPGLNLYCLLNLTLYGFVFIILNTNYVFYARIYMTNYFVRIFFQFQIIEMIFIMEGFSITEGLLK